jgi:hypothetical protein
VIRFCLAAGWAFAITLASTHSAGAPADEPPDFEFGAGLDATLGWMLLDAPAHSAFALPRSGSRAEVHGMSGLGMGAGVSVEGRLLSRIGLHLGAGYSLETMSGELAVAGETISVDLEQPALVVPALLQVFVRFGGITHFVAVGPELVVPIIPLARTDPERRFPVAATAETYARLSVGWGAELPLPFRAVDLRIPLVVLGTWNPGLGDELGERVRVLPSDAVIYTATPRFGVRLSLGAGIYF